MRFFGSLLCILLIPAFLAGCRQKKKVSLSGDEPVEVHDFIQFFETTALPVVFADSLLRKKESDSLLISTRVFTQFVPDSVLAPVFGKGARIKIYPLGKAEAAGAETYLFIKAVTAAKRAAYILVFDKKEQYAASLLALRSDAPRAIQTTTVLDKKYTVTRTQSRKNADGSTSEGKDIYAYSADTRDFMLIMTDALGDKITELVNPIDTFPRKHKYAADYGSGKMNLVSIRDGRKSDRLTFFIHIDKDNGECSGELKGEAMLRSANLAEFREAGDPCVLQFRFSSSSVTVKELEGCGAHRGLRCSFNGSFPKKKQARAKSSAAKPASRK